MEKTMSIFDILRMGIKELFGNSNDEIISNEEIENGEISDDKFAEIAKDLDPDIIAQLQKTRNGKGTEKLDSDGKCVEKKPRTPFSRKEQNKEEENPIQQIKKNDLDREERE